MRPIKRFQPHAAVIAALAGIALLTAPAHAATPIQWAVDLFQSDFYPNYTDGEIVGQAAGPGFNTIWTGVTATVGSSVVTANSGTGRTGAGLFPHNEYTGTVGDSGATTVYFRTRMALGTGAGFQALELADSAAGFSNLIQLAGGAGFGVYSYDGDFDAGIVALPGTNDGGFHEWLVAVDTATGAGTVWIDAITLPSGLGGNFDPSVGGTAFTASPGFAFNATNLASFGTSSVSVDYMMVGGNWEGVLLTVVPEPSSAALLGLGALALLHRRRQPAS